MTDNANTLNVELSDAQHRTAMEASSRLMIQVLRGQLASPPGLMWRERASPFPDARDPDSLNSREADYRVTRIAERDAMAEGLRVVDRTPCPRCGVRADVGCRHSASTQHILSHPEYINKAWEAEIAGAVARRLDTAA